MLFHAVSCMCWHSNQTSTELMYTQIEIGWNAWLFYNIFKLHGVGDEHHFEVLKNSEYKPRQWQWLSCYVLMWHDCKWHWFIPSFFSIPFPFQTRIFNSFILWAYSIQLSIYYVSRCHMSILELINQYEMCIYFPFLFPLFCCCCGQGQLGCCCYYAFFIIIVVVLLCMCILCVHRISP